MLFLKFMTGTGDCFTVMPVSTVAGSTTYGFVNGTGTSARFRNPDGVVIDHQDNIIVTDRTITVSEK